MIPVLMGMILLLQLSAPKPSSLPTAASHARWLSTDDTPSVSLAFDDASALVSWAGSALAGRAWTTRTMDDTLWVRIPGDTAWIDENWPGQPRAVAAIGQIALPRWDRLVNKTQGQDVASMRTQPDFAFQALAARYQGALARTPDADPATVFAGIRHALADELTRALDAPNTALPLLERMALENLAPDWHLRLANQITPITFDEFSAWQNQ